MRGDGRIRNSTAFGPGGVAVPLSDPLRDAFPSTRRRDGTHPDASYFDLKKSAVR